MLIRIVSAICLLASAGSAIDRREPVPAFNARTLDGAQFASDSLRGKVVLLQFWATWCGYCRREQPIVDKLTKEFAGRGLVVLAVNSGESKKKVKQFLAEAPRTCPIVLMEDTNLVAMFAPRSYPFYVVIDRDGRIVARQDGAAGEDALRRMLSRAGLVSD